MSATKVAVATDRSPGGDHAVRWAVDLAVAQRADLLVIQVLDEATATDDDALLRDLVGLAGGEGPGRVEAAVRRSEAVAEEIVATAEGWGADLVVVGNSGMRGRKQFLLGNVANRVSHLATCSVLIASSAPVTAGGGGAGGGGAGRGAPATVSESARAREVARELLPVLARIGGEDDLEGARRLRQALERLGPTFSKIGQILSTRPDLLGPATIAELSKLRSSVPPMSEAEVVSTMEAELGVPWEDVFADIDAEPLAAGTIGQVHRAELADGTAVVVKVQRPAAAPSIEVDLALLERVSRQVAKVPKVAGVSGNRLSALGKSTTAMIVAK